MNHSNLFGLSDHLEALSKHGEPLEVLDATVDFEYFRGWAPSHRQPLHPDSICIPADETPSATHGPG